MHSNSQPQDCGKYTNALLQNNSVLLSELYRNFYPAIKRMVVKYKGNDSDADDVFQEALTAICIKAKNGEADTIGDFCSYLYMTCRNIWISQLKKNKRFTKLSPGINERLSNEDNADSESIERQANRIEMFEAAITKLTPRCREILQLRGSGKSISEIVELLGLTNGYVRRKLCTTKKQLRISMRQSPKVLI